MGIRLRHTEDGSFRPAEHLEFVRNAKRNSAFQAAFEKFANGKTVLDVGTGSGIMAILAKKAGASKVIAVENDPVMADIAHANFERNGFSDIELLRGDALDFRKGDLPRIDILVGELLSTWCIVEPQVPVFEHLFSILGGAPISIPKRVINYAEGVHAQFGDRDGLVEIVTTHFEFDSTSPKAGKMTARSKALEIIFSKEMALDALVQVVLRASQTGIINALRLSSSTETCDGVTFGSTNDTMPNMIVPLPQDINVIKNQEFGIGISCTFGLGWGEFKVHQLS